MDGVLAALSDTNIRVLFSDSQPNSAHLIASLAEKESARKHSLPKVCDLPSTDSPDFKRSMAFYQSLPDVGIGVALQPLQEALPVYSDYDSMLVHRKNDKGLWQSDVYTGASHIGVRNWRRSCTNRARRGRPHTKACCVTQVAPPSHTPSPARG